jgi:UV DNA damage endonuclease
MTQSKIENPKSKIPRLGLVCITSSDLIRYRTITRKRLWQFEPPEQERLLRELYQDNLNRLNKALIFCDHKNIRLYRIPASLFPFADNPLGEAILLELSASLATIGRQAAALGIRLVNHPDQFVVLNSDFQTVIDNSLKILSAQALVMDLLEQPRSPWALIELHGGKSNRAERLVEVIDGLPEAIHSRLALENDEYSYSAAKILETCRAAHIPMVFDAHHHICYESLVSYEDPSIAEMIAAARETWPVPEWQLVHLSNGRSTFGDRQHSDFIQRLPSAYVDLPWIEVEAKKKELAIEHLLREWGDISRGEPLILPL